MARKVASEPPFGSDSFLDVTANLVGVLIILIVLVGLRVAQAPPQVFCRPAPHAATVDQAGSDLNALGVEHDQREQELDLLGDALRAKESALEQLRSCQGRLGEANAALEDQFRAQRKDLDQEASQLAEARSRLVSLDQELRQRKAAASPPRPLVYRSPLSQPVNGDEVHFEIRSGRIAFLDLAGLMERAKLAARQADAELRDRGEVSREVGPVGGFRLKFTLAREDMPFAESLLYAAGSFRARLVEWEAEPIDSPRGETVEAAERPGSQFQAVLARHSPKKSAVTLWVYPDGFTTLRALRDQLHDLGYSVAARPLPRGAAIRGSRHGSRSFAQYARCFVPSPAEKRFATMFLSPASSERHGRSLCWKACGGASCAAL